MSPSEPLPPSLPPPGNGRAWFAGAPGTPGVLAEHIVEHASDPAVLDRGGWWALLLTFEGRLDLWRFADVRPGPPPAPGAHWAAVSPGAWADSLPHDPYVDAVAQVRRRIRDGEVYQANLCRVLSAPVPQRPDPWSLAAVLAAGNPAPYAGVVDIPGAGRRPGAWVVSASPELFLRRTGPWVESSPIKGTGATSADLLPKDDAENIMIVDLVRNDLQHVCTPGTVEVTALLRREEHPGLVHLVSTVRGRLAEGSGWAALLAATTPPGSVSGAPKSSALATISDLERAPRGPYCGAVGWVDADAGTAVLAVGIRTFWWHGGHLRFGTGAGITWGSDPEQEWAETQLKAHRLLGLAAMAAATGPVQGTQKGSRP